MPATRFELAQPARFAQAMADQSASPDWSALAEFGKGDGLTGGLITESMRRLESLFIRENRDTTGEPRRVRIARWQ